MREMMCICITGVVLTASTTTPQPPLTAHPLFSHTRPPSPGFVKQLTLAQGGRGVKKHQTSVGVGGVLAQEHACSTGWAVILCSRKGSRFPSGRQVVQEWHAHVGMRGEWQHYQSATSGGESV